jgi:DNA primase catalytic subunit
MSNVLKHVIDALDVETFLVCESEEEGKNLGLALMKDLGFKDVDIVFSEFVGVGARIRARAYIHKAGDSYPWLDLDKSETA